jgi:hypothetical protein
MSKELVPVVTAGTALQPSVDEYSRRLLGYIDDMGLPTDGVLVGVAERRRVIMNLPEVVGNLSAERRLAAMYISKFVAACSGGLFDAALNYLWDETVVNLRAKVVRFDLAYFYASAIESEDQRKNFKTEDDLVKLDDWALIRGCRQIGILSEIGFKHLDYIRDMRNWASAAHPNHTELTGLQLSAWLETCIREVLIKEPEGPGVEVRALLYNLRNESLTAGDIPAIEAALQRLPEEIARSLLRTIFGMFVDPKIDAEVKDNIRLVSRAAWGASSEDARYEVGLRYATYSANGDVTRKTTAKEFLDRVRGLGYLPTDTLAVELNEQLDNLSAAHYAFSNYANEVPHAKSLARYVPENAVIPQAILSKYVKILLLCRVGDATWGDGVSTGAKPYYDRLLAKMQEREILELAKLLADSDVTSRLQFKPCQQNFMELVKGLRPKVTNIHLARALDAILGASLAQLRVLGSDSKYKAAVKAVVL